MKINALTDSPFLRTPNGRSTVRDLLLSSHKQDTAISVDGAAYQFTAQLRFLAEITAVALRHTSTPIEEIVQGGLPENAVDQAIADLAPGCDPFDSIQPFLQRPPLPCDGPKEKAHLLMAGHFPIKKLSPAMLPDEGETYWNLINDGTPALALPDALLALVVYHHLSMAGNNNYAGDKCQMGAPGMRFVGADYTATEIIQTGDTLLETLLYQIPTSWVKGSGLPAWADRTCNNSTLPDAPNQAHPLWRATWSSNAPACHWEDGVLNGVRTGGIPEEWYFKPEMGTNKTTYKEWWDQRNTLDPFYLYETREKGGETLVRVDLGRDNTDLAVEWAANNRSNKVHARISSRALSRLPNDAPLIFAQHLIAGTASSPNIRASEVFFPSSAEWAFDVDEDLQEDIQLQAKLINQLHRRVCQVFSRKPTKSKYPPAVLDDMIDRKQDASNAFWRNISAVYQDILNDARRFYKAQSPSPFTHSYEMPTDLRDRCIDASLCAFDEVVNPHSIQEPARIAYVRAQLRNGLQALIPKPASTEESF